MRIIRNIAGLVVGASVVSYWAWSQALAKMDTLIVPVLTEEKRRDSLAQVPPKMWAEGDIVRYKFGDSGNTLIFIDHAEHDGNMFLAEYSTGFGYFNTDEFVLHELNDETRGVL